MNGSTAPPMADANILHTHSLLNEELAEYAATLRPKYIRNTRVLLIQSLQFQLDAFNADVASNRAYYVYPPAGLQSLVNAVEHRNVQCEIFDLNLAFLKRVSEDATFNPKDWLTLVDEKLHQFDPSIVGVSCIGVATDLFKSTHPLTAVLQHVKSTGKQLVIAGGPIATDEAENYLNHDVCHFVVRGEGENKFNYLLDHLYDAPLGEPLKDICFKNKGLLHESQGRKDVVRVQGNLVNSYADIQIEDYQRYGSLNPFSRMVGRDTPFSTFLLNRGCRANCKFCGVPKLMGKGVRQSPVQDVLDEITYLVDERGIRHFELLDDDFLGSSAQRDGVVQVLSCLKGLREKHGDITWSAGNGLIAASMDAELMRLIHDSGCVGYRIGIESGNAAMLKRLRKPASLKSIRQFVELSRPYDSVFVSANYILGLFGEETFGEMLDTFRLSCELDLDWSNYSTYQFTSKKTTRVENLKDDGAAATEFLPIKDAKQRIVSVADGLRSGMDIFNLDVQSVPSREQVKEIWFVFNFLSNYVYNRNLAPGGNPVKLISWLQAIQLSYPDNAYMPLFTALALVIEGNNDSAHEQARKVERILAESPYWRDRFEQLDLYALYQPLPKNAFQVHQSLAILRERFAPYSYTKEEYVPTDEVIVERYDL